MSVFFNKEYLQKNKKRFSLIAIVLLLFIAMTTLIVLGSVGVLDSKHELAFKTNSEEQLSPITFKKGGEILLPDNLTKEGYDFQGWFVDEVFSTSFNISNLKNKNITIYAKWSPKIFEITFETNGGSEVADISQAYNSNITLPSSTKEAYTFDGWYIDEDFQTPFTATKMPLNGAELFAKWSYTPFDNTLAISANNIIYGNNLDITIETNTSGGEVTYLYKLQGADDSTYSTTLPTIVGDYTLKAISAATALYKQASTTADFAINKANYNMSSVAWNYTIAFGYDGQEKIVEVTGLPNGVTVASYTDNSKTDAGSYTASVLFAYDTVNYNQPTLADLEWWVIEKAENTFAISANNIVYGNSFDITIDINTSGGEITYLYKAQGADDITYTSVEPTIVGEYTVKATSAETSNYISAFDTADFSIEKANYDMSGVTFVDTSLEYDGTEKSIFVSGILPAGVEVSYLNNSGNIDPNVYEVTAVFTGDNYNYYSISNMTAELTIFTLLLIEESLIGDKMAAYLGDDISPLKLAFDLCIVSVGNSTSHNILIPDTYYGKEINAIAGYGFENYPMTSIRIGNNIRIIGEFAFSGSNLQSVTLPANVESVNGSAFRNCFSLTEILVDENNNELISIDGVLFGDYGLSNYNPIIAYPIGKTDTSYTIPLATTHIGYYPFCNAKNLTEIVMQENIVEIGFQAFYGCSNLVSLTMGTAVTNIFDSAFENCESLESVTLPETLVYMAPYAFKGCTSLNTVNALRSSSSYNITNASNDMFLNCHPDLVIYVADFGSEQAYNAHSNWKPSGATYTIVAIEYTVVFDYNGADGGDTTESILVKVGASYGTLPTPTRTGYTFDGWFTEEIEGTLVESFTSVPSAGNHNLYARFMPILYTVTFDYMTADGNTDTIDIDVYFDSIYGALPQPTMTNYLFEGWFTDNNILITNNTILSIPSDHTLYASFYTGGLEYFVYGQGYSVAKGSATMADVIVPKTHLGAPILGIADNGFNNYTALMSIILPEGLEYLGCYSFLNSINLQSITLPESLLTIDLKVFSDCGKLSEINIPKNVTYIAPMNFLRCYELTSINVDPTNLNYKSIDGVLYSKDESVLLAYPSGKAGNTYVVIEGVTTIQRYAFENSNFIENITLPETLQTIEYSAFKGMKISSLHLPKNVENIEDEAFSRCLSLATFTVDADSSFFTANDGILFSKDMTTICCYPAKKTYTKYTIPHEVSTIKGDAFIMNIYLKELIVPETVTDIEVDSFKYLTSLKSVIFSATTSSLSRLFRNCYALEYITFTSITPMIIISDCFASSPTSPLELRIFVPSGSVDAYKAEWTDFANNIYAIPVVSFDTDCETIIDSVIADAQRVARPIDPEKTGYTFINWYKEATFTTLFDFNDIIAANTTVFAKLEANTYMLTFDKVDGEGGSDNMVATFDSEMPTAIAPTRGELFFDGYYSEQNGAGKKYYNSDMSSANTWDITEDTTLYAHWYTDGLTYTAVTGGYHVSKGSATMVDIVVPQNKDGIPIIGIANSGFANFSALISIILPESLQTIGYSAFNYCESLVELNFPKNLSSMGTYNLIRCISLSSINVDELNQHYKSIDGVLLSKDGSILYAYPLNKAGVTYTVPNGVTTIAREAFYQAKLESITFPESLITIEYEALCDMELLSLNLPKNLETIEQGAFKSCENLVAFTVEADSAFFTAVDGVLFTKDMTNLLYYPQAKTATEYNIPEGVETVKTDAFYWNEYLTAINFSSSVTTIERSAFYGIKNVVELVIPETVTTIGSSAFDAFFSLKSVIFSANVTSLYSPFPYCYLLEYVTFTRATPINLFGNPFWLSPYNNWNPEPGISRELRIFVPSESVDAYKAAWVDPYPNPDIKFDFSNNIYAIPVVTFDTDCETIIDSVIADAQRVARPATVPAKENYTFIDWYADAAFTTLFDFDKIITTDTTVFAKLEGNQYTVTFDMQGGTNGTESVIASYGSAMPAAIAPTMTGYTFGGYFTSTDGGGTQYYSQAMESVQNWDIIENTTLYAQWTFGTQGLLFTPINGDTAYSVSKGTSTDLHVVIPSVYNGKPVTTLPDYAFHSYSTLLSITFPLSITSVGARTLTGCNSLTTLTAPFKATAGFTDNSFINYYFDSGMPIPASLKTVIVADNGITSIGERAFHNAQHLTTIVLPNSITSFGYRAFSGCSSITNIILPDSLISIGEEAFYNCTSLSSIIIPEGVTEISTQAFLNCSSLTELTIPTGVATIESRITVGCTSLTTFTAPFKGTYNVLHNSHLSYFFATVPASLKTVIMADNGITSVANNAFLGASSVTTVILPDSITSIGNSAFANCSSLTNIILPDSVTIIGNSAFSGCSSLTSIILPDSISNIGSNAFKQCTLLSSIIIPEGITEILTEAFALCTSLTELTIPTGITTIGIGIINGCTSIETLTAPFMGTYQDGTNSYLRYFFGATSSSSTVIIIPSSLKTVNVADNGITSIGNTAFWICANITTITMPDTITSVGNHAFYGCSALSELALPAGVTTIGNHAFRSCGLIELTMPEGVLAIGENAFSHCSNLTTVTMKGSTPPTAGASMFFECNNLTAIYVPVGSVNAYETATNWITYEPIIVGYTVMSFDTNGGEEIAPMHVNSTTILPTPIKYGYVFVNWYTDATFTTLYNFNNISTASATVFAKFVATYTITFDKAGGEGGSDNVVAVFGSAMPPAAAPTREDYFFGGYFTEAEGNGEQYYDWEMMSVNDWDIAENTILYAYWYIPIEG